MSMKPGATTLPAASMVRLRAEAERLPMAAILPSRIPMSPEYHGEPVPSMMWPFVMTMSKEPAVWAGRVDTNNDDAQKRRIRIELIHFQFTFISLSFISLLPG